MSGGIILCLLIVIAGALLAVRVLHGPGRWLPARTPAPGVTGLNAHQPEAGAVWGWRDCGCLRVRTADGVRYAPCPEHDAGFTDEWERRLRL